MTEPEPKNTDDKNKSAWAFIGEILSRPQPKDIPGQIFVPGFEPAPLNRDEKRDKRQQQKRLF